LNELTAQFERPNLGSAQGLHDLLARATTQRWSPANCWKKSPVPRDLARRSLECPLAQARLRRFKPVADFELDCPQKIDRPWIERALTMDFLTRGRNLICAARMGFG